MTTVPVTTQDRIPIPMSVPARPAQVPMAMGMSLPDIWRVIKQRFFWPMLPILIIVPGLFTLATFLLLRGATLPILGEYPRFEAAGVVGVQVPRLKPMEFGEGRETVDVINRRIADEIFRIRQPDILSKVLVTSQVMQTDWYKKENDKDKLLVALQKGLEVRQAPDVSAFYVIFETRKPSDAVAIVEQLMETYERFAADTSRTKYVDEKTGVFLKQQADLRTELGKVTTEIKNLVTLEGSVAGLAENKNLESEKLRGLLLESARAESDKALVKAQWDFLRGVDPSQLEPTPEVMAALDSDPQIFQLKQALIFGRQELDELLRRLGPNHKSVLARVAQLTSLEREVEVLIAQRQKQGLELQSRQAERAYNAAFQTALALQEQILEERAKAKDADKILLEYQRLLDQQRALEEELAKLNEHINQLDLIIENEDQRAKVNILQRPREAKKPSSPKYLVNVPVGVLLGILLSFGVAMLLELMDTSVRTSRDVSRHAHIPILGTIPDLDFEEIPIETIELAVHAAPRSMIAEAFRTVRANLTLTAPAERQRSILVTSAQPGEGKTTVAVNLAIAIAQNNRRVLLIDANFHRPALRQFFANIPTEGLSNVLIGQSKLADVVVKTNLPNLDVVGSGPIPPNPSELMTSTYMRQLLSQATDTYDQVVFDGPPALLVSDAMVLAGSLDGVILVCRANSTSRGVLLRAREQFERAGIRIFGGVLNGASGFRGGYFREQIRSYYEYQPAAEHLAGPTPKALPGESKGPQKL
ncbi:MAG: polysaccharide biosynthesis tyrosine autokinase [Phycisphaerae bacterium]|nr:polysaccharide biosynthesis tyrosine autokinase [Phycisphaerae bacterium]